MKRWPWIAMTGLLIVSVALTACNPPSNTAGTATPAGEQATTSVDVAQAEVGTISVIYTYPADLQAQASVKVMPIASGRLKSVTVQVGDEVTSGESLAQIESNIYAAQLKQAQSGLEAAQLQLAKMQEGTRPEQIAAAQAAVQFARDAVNDKNTISDDERTAAVAGLAQAEVALKQAQAQYDKVAWAGQVGALPQSAALEQATVAYEAAKAAYDLQTNPSDLELSPLMNQLAQAELALALAENPYTDNDFEQARNQINQAQAAVDLAQIQLDETVIRAPIDGVVSEVYVDQGDMAGPGSAVALIISKDMVAQIEVEESRINRVEAGQSASIQVTAYPGQDFPAVVTSVAPAADSSSHTFTVKVTPGDNGGQLRAGMFANVSLLVQENKGVVTVPIAAVTQVGGKNVVYVVQDNVATMRQVTVGATDSQCCVEILDGVNAGETVVTAGQANLVDGAAVEIMNTTNG